MTKCVAVGLNLNVSQFSHILVDDAVCFCKIDNVHGLKDLGKSNKKMRATSWPSSILLFFLSYLRPLPEPLRLLLELELLVELLLEELVPLLRVLLLELLTLPLELPLVPLLRVLLLELFTLLLELPLLPLGRLLLFELFMRLLELLLPVRPLELLLVPLLELPTLPLPLLTFGRLLSELPLLAEPADVPLLKLPELMLPPLGLGLTVALGAAPFSLGFGSGLLFHSWLAG